MRFRLISLITTIFLTLTLARPAASAPPDVAFAPGAHLRFDHITIDDGLSQNAGLVLLQDSQGYLWIGTQDGLNRYNGYSITQFKHDPDNPSSISFNSIIALYEDQEGSLWVGTWGGGLNRFDPRTGQFTRYQPDPANPASLSHPVVTHIVGDGSGSLWVGSLGGLDRLDPKTGAFTHFRHDPNDPTSLSSDAISVIVPAGDGKLWIGTGAFNTPGAGLNLFDPADGTAQRMLPRAECLVPTNISDILPDSQGSLWISYGGYGITGGGLDRFNPTTGACSHYDSAETLDNQITDNNLTDLAFDQQGGLWAATWSTGVWHMSPAGQLSVIRHDPADPESLSNDNTYSLLPDRSGVIWIGTLSAGINKLDLDTLQFRTYRSDASDPNSLPSSHVSSFAQSRDGALWVGTWESGLARFDPQHGTFTAFRADPENPNSLSSDLVMALQAAADGTLWAGTLGGGLNHFDPHSARFTRYQNDPTDATSLLDNQVTSILHDPAGRLWVGSFAGLSRLDPGAAGFINYPLPAPPVSLAVIGDELWIGTWGGGVYRLDLAGPASLDPSLAAFTTLVHDPTNPNSLSQNGVWTILQTPDRMVWLGTEGGLNRYDPQTGQFKVYTEKNGLRNTTILGILQDAQGYLWLTTNNGLAKFDPQTETFRIYDKSDGLQSNEFNSNAYFQTASGEIYVGGISGFSVFDPLNLSQNDTAPPVVITNFSVFNTPQPFDPSGADPIRLKYDQNFISFEFAALDFHAPGRNQYAYMLAGFDQDWVQAGTRSYASYTNLPGGEYTFRVRAANSDGVWNETGAALKLTVTPPVWQTLPFQLGLLIGVISLVAAGFQWRVRAVREQNARLQKLVGEQQRVEAELRESEARFRTVFETSAIGIGLMGLDRKVIKANPALCQMYGYTGEELVGQTSALVVHPDDYPRSAQLLQDLLSGKFDQYTNELRYIRKNGQAFWARTAMSMVRDTQGAPLYIVGMVADINDQRMALAKLQESENRFRAIFENAAIGISLIAPDGRVLAVNPVLVRLSGRSEADLIALGGQGITYPEDRDVGRQEFSEIIAGKRDSFQVEKRYVHKDGSVQWMRQSISAVRDPEGSTLYLVVVAEDIDERKRAIEELRESEARFRAMYNNAAVGMALISLDRRVISINETSARITGYSIEELVGTNAGTLAHPEDAAIAVDQFNDLVAGNIPQYQMEKRFIRKNGEIFWGRVSYSSVPGSNGLPEYLVGMIEDITEEREAARTLIESEARFRTLYDSSEMGIVLVDLGSDGKVPLDEERFKYLVANQRLNPAMLRMFGYSAEELKSRPISSLIYPEDQGIDAKPFRQVLKGEIDSFRIEKRFVRKDGSVFWGRLTDSLARTADGAPRMVIGIIEDISAERQAKERLAAQEADHRRLLEERIAERTLELNQANELLREKAAQDAVAAERTRLARDLHDAVTQTLFSTTLIADVLPQIWTMNPDEGMRRLEEVRQLTRGALAEMRTLLVELRPNALVEVPLPTLLRQLTEALIGRSRMSIQLSAEGDRKLPADVQVGLYRIAQEALNNVVKHAKASQAVVTLHCGETIRLTVADNGAGFTPSTVTADHLGLKIMRERAEAIGARLSIYSEPGEGTQISVVWETKTPTPAEKNGSASQTA